MSTNNRVIILSCFCLFALAAISVQNTQATELVKEPSLDMARKAGRLEIGFYDPESNSMRLRHDRLAMRFANGATVDIFRILKMKDGLFLIREGSDTSHNCVISRTPVEFGPDGALLLSKTADTQTCTGYKCKKCDPPNGSGCSDCKITIHKDARCDHSITTGGIIKPEILMP